jgi:hypothetical protein
MILRRACGITVPLIGYTHLADIPIMPNPARQSSPLP